MTTFPGRSRVYRAGPSWRLLDVLDERRLSVVAGARARVAEVAWAQRAEATGAAFARSMLVVAGAALGVGRRRPVIRPRRIAEAEGWDAVTIRRLATELGVTQPVLYTAFGKRQDIVDAVALRGFAELAAALDAGDPAAAYLDFARAHPATYEAMFLMPTGLRFAAADVPAPMRVAFTALGRALGIADDVRTEIAWSLLHGVASLDRAGRLSAGARGRRLAELERLLDVLTAGVAPGASD